MLHCLHSSFDQKKWKNSISKPSAITKRDMAQLWRICAVFFWIFPLLVAKHYKKIDRASNRVQLWSVCAVFFWIFPFLAVDAGVEPAETVFKGVELMHITLNSPGL